MQEQLLLEVAERYNTIMGFLKGYDAATRDYLSYILIQLVPQFESIDEVEGFLAFLETNKMSEMISSSKMMYENTLKSQLSKPSIDWLFDNPPSYQ